VRGSTPRHEGAGNFRRTTRRRSRVARGSTPRHEGAGNHCLIKYYNTMGREDRRPATKGLETYKHSIFTIERLRGRGSTPRHEGAGNSACTWCRAFLRVRGRRGWKHANPVPTLGGELHERIDAPPRRGWKPVGVLVVDVVVPGEDRRPATKGLETARNRPCRDRCRRERIDAPPRRGWKRRDRVEAFAAFLGERIDAPPRRGWKLGHDGLGRAGLEAEGDGEDRRPATKGLETSYRLRANNYHKYERIDAPPRRGWKLFFRRLARSSIALGLLERIDAPPRRGWKRKLPSRTRIRHRREDRRPATKGLETRRGRTCRARRRGRGSTPRHEGAGNLSCWL
jgi:hypothetical protein